MSERNKAMAEKEQSESSDWYKRLIEYLEQEVIVKARLEQDEPATDAEE